MSFIPYNINHLKYFCDAVAHGSVSKAASQNHISQSGISQGISCLEKALNCQLLHHQKKRFEVTAQGERLFQDGMRVLGQLASLRDLSSMADHEIGGTLTVGVSHSLALTYLSQCYLYVREHFPKLHLQFRFAQIAQLIEWVKAGRVDVAFVVRNMDLSTVDFESILQGQFRIYRSKYSVNRSINDGIMVPDVAGAEVYQLQLACQEVLGFNPTLLPSVPSWEVLAQFVSLDLGLGLLPDYLVKERHENLVAMDPDLHVLYEIGTITRKKQTVSRKQTAFLSALKAVLK